jgi:hypothetical protein
MFRALRWAATDGERGRRGAWAPRQPAVARLLAAPISVHYVRNVSHDNLMHGGNALARFLRHALPGP